MNTRRPRQTYKDEDVSLLRRVFTFRLSLLGLLGLSGASLLAVGWIFALGVIIGRGYDPEDKLPMLGRLMPPAQTVEEDEDILKPEDLTFFTDLRTQPTLSTEPPAQAPERRVHPSNPDQPAPAARPDRPDQPVRHLGAPEGTSELQAVERAEQEERQSRPQSAPNRPAENVASGERFDFVYQVIAYRRAEQADNFRDKLEQAGLRTRLNIERDEAGKARFYRVQILVSGTEGDRDRALDILARHGVKDPILSSRKPVGG